MSVADNNEDLLFLKSGAAIIIGDIISAGGQGIRIKVIKIFITVDTDI